MRFEEFSVILHLDKVGDTVFMTNKTYNQNNTFLFEIANEVCNPIGGIYTVVSSLTHSFKSAFGSNVICIGPDRAAENRFFEPLKTKYQPLAKAMSEKHGINIRVGLWILPVPVCAILIDHTPIFDHLNEIKGSMWNEFHVDSLHAYDDYDDAAAFGYAAGILITEFLNLYQQPDLHYVAHFHEWNSAFGLLYTKKHLPSVATLFTAHATVVGRSIAGNGKPLYDYFGKYNGNQMAYELNVEAKHSVERAAAHAADVFTTVSENTAREAEQFLEKRPEVVTPNGIAEYNLFKYRAATIASTRERLIEIANQYLGTELTNTTKIIATSGRFEIRNKGYDLFLSALEKVHLNEDEQLLALVLVPSWHAGTLNVLPNIPTTHLLNEPDNNAIIQILRSCRTDERLKVLYVPVFLDGHDGALNMTYHQIISALHLAIFPSYYEPWGYTPLETAAAGVPTITTSCAGFGDNVKKDFPNAKGVMVLERTDSNYDIVAQQTATKIEEIIRSSDADMLALSNDARKIAEHYLWKEMFKHYLAAIPMAIEKRLNENK